MLPGVDTLVNNLLALKPTTDKVQGIQNFVAVVAAYTNQVQAGSDGTPGIFTFNQPAMVAGLMSQQPVADNSWISNFVSAWRAGVLAATITPGTVTDPSWLGSVTDTLTSAAVESTIPNVGAAAAALTSGLNSVSAQNNPPRPLAQALHDAVASFEFLCIGLGPPPTLAPIPKTFGAQ